MKQEETSKLRRKARRNTNKAAEEKKTAEEGVFMHLAVFKIQVYFHSYVYFNLFLKIIPVIFTCNLIFYI